MIGYCKDMLSKVRQIFCDITLINMTNRALESTLCNAAVHPQFQERGLVGQCFSRKWCPCDKKMGLMIFVSYNLLKYRISLNRTFFRRQLQKLRANTIYFEKAIHCPTLFLLRFHKKWKDSALLRGSVKQNRKLTMVPSIICDVVL